MMERQKIPTIQFPGTQPVLVTERLELRPLTPDNTDDLFDIYSNERIMRPYIARTHTLKIHTDGLIRYYQDAFNRHQTMIWGIFRKENPDKLIGDAGFWRFVEPRMRGEQTGKMDPKFWNQGYMTEVIEVVTRYGFQALKLNSIEVAISPENTLSIGLVEGRGFEKEGYIKENAYCPFQKKYVDTVLYSLRFSQWKQRHEILPLDSFIGGFQ